MSRPVLPSSAASAARQRGRLTRVRRPTSPQPRRCRHPSFRRRRRRTRGTPRCSRCQDRTDEVEVCVVSGDVLDTVIFLERAPYRSKSVGTLRMSRPGVGSDRLRGSRSSSRQFEFEVRPTTVPDRPAVSVTSQRGGRGGRFVGVRFEERRERDASIHGDAVVVVESSRAMRSTGATGSSRPSFSGTCSMPKSAGISVFRPSVVASVAAVTASDEPWSLDATGEFLRRVSTDSKRPSVPADDRVDRSER